jgi:excisionase family DNA binding protein
MLTVKEAALLLGIKECTVRLWLAQRKLSFVRCGRAVRIPKREIKDFIERNTIPARVPRNGR